MLAARVRQFGRFSTHSGKKVSIDRLEQAMLGPTPGFTVARPTVGGAAFCAIAVPGAAQFADRLPYLTSTRDAFMDDVTHVDFDNNDHRALHLGPDKITDIAFSPSHPTAKCILLGTIVFMGLRGLAVVCGRPRTG